MTRARAPRKKAKIEKNLIDHPRIKKKKKKNKEGGHPKKKEFVSILGLNREA